MSPWLQDCGRVNLESHFKSFWLQDCVIVNMESHFKSFVIGMTLSQIPHHHFHFRTDIL